MPVSVAVIGANGYVGRELCNALTRNPGILLTRVTRDNYGQIQKASFDILINSAMPSKRFWAKNNPVDDFRETVKKTADLVYGWRFKKFIQISTLSARCQLDTVYGRHKAAAEKLCGFDDNLIVRLGPMYSKDLSKGVLMDILEGRKVFVDGESKYCFAPLDFSASWVAGNLDCSGIVEVGARNSIRLREVADYLGFNVEFVGALDNQEVEKPLDVYPDAHDALAFIDIIRKQK